MEARIARLVNSFGYRTKLAESLPDIEAELYALMEEDQVLRTRRWLVKRLRGSLLLCPSRNSGGVECLPLEFDHHGASGDPPKHT